MTVQLREACDHGCMRDMVRPPPHPPNPDCDARAPQTGCWSDGRSTGEMSQDRGGQEAWPLATHDEVEVQLPDVWPQVNNDDRGVQSTRWTPDMSTLMPPVNSTTVPRQNHGQPLQCQGTPRPPSLQLNPHLWRPSLSQSQQPQLQLPPQPQAWPWSPSQTVANRNMDRSLYRSSDTCHHYVQVA